MKVIYSFILFFLFLAGSSCNKQPEFENTPTANMEALWKIIDENYCFFDYKHLNWDSIHTVFMPRVKDHISQEALLKIMDEMLDLLQDGHVNVITAFDIARYWEWYENYPTNFDANIQRNYLGFDYAICGGMKVQILSDNIGYLYYPSFSGGVSFSNMDFILNKCALCEGLIIDIRNNGGGQLTNVKTIAASFATQKTHIGYLKHKTGKGHADFSKPLAQYLYPRKDARFNFYKPVVVLTNRHCYSAANDFVNVMKQLPNVTIIGDKTGGGSGLPFSSELPNGWSVRFSSSPSFGPQMNQIEFGIAPDIKVDMTKEDVLKGLDTIIEKAKDFIHKKEK